MNSFAASLHAVRVCLATAGGHELREEEESIELLLFSHHVIGLLLCLLACGNLNRQNLEYTRQYFISHTMYFIRQAHDQL